MKSGTGVLVIILILLGMVMLPLPPFILDLLFTFNITLSLIMLLAGIYTKRPIDFSVFPTLLLVATLLRLGLNIASTRVVLLNGHTGDHAAGQVIASFGEVVIGSNTAVGLVVFSILVVINFVVVTKGAGRISEVSARFTLDAMPGKQMAIDADLNAGLITADEARARRSEVGREADFYGSMDGASKFVRGDAIAGILILFINMLGGLFIGVFQHDLPLDQAFRTYSLLTIGDGLAAQIPALLLSVIAALMVTRASHSQDVGQQVVEQLFTSEKPLKISASILGILGLVPGMPHLVFLALGGITYGISTLFTQAARHRAEEALKQKEAAGTAKPGESDTTPDGKPKEIGWDDVQAYDPLGIEIGFRLIPLADESRQGALLSRIRGIRKKLSQDYGFLLPAVHIRDNLEIMPNVYRVTLNGVTSAQGQIQPDCDLAIDPGQVSGKIGGIHTKDPAFGLDAYWINTSEKDKAIGMGYTVVDASTVIATHLSHILTQSIHTLFGHEEGQQWLTQLQKRYPKAAEELVPKILTLPVLVKVLQQLLFEHIPINDMRTISQTLIEHGVRTQDPALLTAAVRIALGRLIVQNVNGSNPDLEVAALDPQLEQILHQAAQSQSQKDNLEPSLTERLGKALSQFVEKQTRLNQPAILVTPPILRPILARLFRHTIPMLTVLSYLEIPDDKTIRVSATLGGVS